MCSAQVWSDATPIDEEVPIFGLAGDIERLCEPVGTTENAVALLDSLLTFTMRGSGVVPIGTVTVIWEFVQVVGRMLLDRSMA